MEQIWDKTPFPAPGITVVGATADEPLTVETRLYGDATREPIKVKPKPACRKERELFGYCDLPPPKAPDYVGDRLPEEERKKARRRWVQEQPEPTFDQLQVLADKQPELTDKGPKGPNQLTPRLHLPPSESADEGTRQVEWSKKGKGSGISYYLKIWHKP